MISGSFPPTTLLETIPDLTFLRSVGDSAFFVMDTRAYRSPNENTDDEEKTMLGEVQREAFLNWAATVNQTVTWKFIVSSVPMMSLWSEFTPPTPQFI